ncbi:YbaB/EbfC family nucleoid-associated protein [Nocardia sp. CDC159]|uniref:YbaB/EbfC family nucleoid-associated protein n=1 Tax=Nocardia pulmonis TaxID=2951408 RepID=A0A9X2IY19_9NOCA|nr:MULTISPECIES: YbaB/EbfC family nucleoid-associated protein [Nocardia]MCM6774490.1 YbaB/EbfC family nucleoid-associated protein [Nocardia pulmonis]MCM6787444.1 YbaB/EbfC family nucleoid-associated protein [Nocardia sp. CDC159]
MTDLPAWEQQLQQNLAEIRRNSEKIAEAVATVRGRGETRGVTVEVDAAGDITSLQIAPAAMRWHNNQLSTAITDCHRRARADAKAKAERIMQRADPRLQAPLRELFGGNDSPQKPPPRRPMTEAEIQAADDAYFERMNRSGWGK